MKTVIFLILLLNTIMGTLFQPGIIESQIFLSRIPQNFQITDFISGFANHLQNLENSISSNLCIEKIGNMTSQFLTDNSFSNIIAFSSRNLNDIGDYMGCKENNDKSYYLSTIIYISGFPAVRLGFCLPRECPYELMLTTREFIAKFFSGLVNMKIYASQINMQDTMELNKKLNEIKPGAYIFIYASGFIILMVLLSTILDWNNFINKPTNVFIKILACFSLKSTLRGLFNTENRIDRKLEILNGIRVLSIGWVVFGHTFFLTVIQPIVNVQDILYDALNTQFMGMVKAGTYSVDIFFMLAGFLATMGFCRAFKNEKNRSIKAILIAYFHRYMRLLPMFAFTMLYTIYIQPIIYDTPSSTASSSLAKKCEEQWYWNLLYLNNFMSDATDCCNGWVWYIMIDTQLFIILPAFCLLYVKSKKLGYLAVLGICSISEIIQIILGIHYKFDLSFEHQSILGEQYNIFYVKPYTRLITYFMGVVFYWIYEDGKNAETCYSFIFKMQTKIQESRIIRYLNYAIGFGLMYLMVYSFYWIDAYKNDWGVTFGVVHLVTSRILFVLGACMTIYPVLIGKGKILLAILGYPIFNFLGKLTYGVYMLHLPILTILSFMTISHKFYYRRDVAIGVIGIFFMAYLCSFLVTIIYESPMVMLLKTFIDPRPQNIKENKPILQNSNKETETKNSE